MRRAVVIMLALAGCQQQPEARRGYDADIVQGRGTAPKAGYQPAPTGDPRSIAAAAIQKAGHPCPKVIAASRLADRSIAAMCGNGEDYRITTIEALGTVAMRCSAVRRMGIKGC